MALKLFWEASAGATGALCTTAMVWEREADFTTTCPLRADASVNAPALTAKERVPEPLVEPTLIQLSLVVTVQS